VTSDFSWLDYSARDQRLMLELIDQIREPGTLDELGLGTIRDGFADFLFPGVSTLQTRARYLLFIPWIFRQLEDDRQVSSAVIGRVSRDRQADLVDALEKGNESEGVIGISARRRLRRPPADIYWGALGQYGIRRYPGSLGAYFARIDQWREGHVRRRQTRRGDGGELVDVSEPNWHALPDGPSDLLTKATFALSSEEARFLEERILLSCPGSLLAHCLRNGDVPLQAIERPADVPGLDGELASVAGESGNFARVLRGAMLLYNLMLAEQRHKDADPNAPSRAQDAERIERYRVRLAEWGALEIAPRLGELRAWQSSGTFRAMVPMIAPRSWQAADFAIDWISIAVVDPSGLADNPAARAAVSQRERRVKRLRSRFANATALANWSGGSGTGEMTYRWINARVLLTDIAAGIAQERAGG